MEKMKQFEESLGLLLKYCFCTVEAIHTCDHSLFLSHCSTVIAAHNSTQNAGQIVPHDILQNAVQTIPHNTVQTIPLNAEHNIAQNISQITPHNTVHQKAQNISQITPHITLQNNIAPQNPIGPLTQECLVFDYLDSFLAHMQPAHEQQLGGHVVQENLIEQIMELIAKGHYDEQQIVNMSQVVSRILETEYVRTHLSHCIPGKEQMDKRYKWFHTFNTLIKPVCSTVLERKKKIRGLSDLIIRMQSQSM